MDYIDPHIHMVSRITRHGAIGPLQPVEGGGQFENLAADLQELAIEHFRSSQRSGHEVSVVDLAGGVTTPSFARGGTEIKVGPCRVAS